MRVHFRSRAVSLCFVAAGLAAALGGGWLIGMWAFGVVLILVGVFLTGWGLFRDDGTADLRSVEPGAWGVHDLRDVLASEARRP